MNLFSSILLSCSMLISTIGFTIQKHYCGSELSEIALYEGASCGCNDGKEDHCCHNEYKTFLLFQEFVIQEHDLTGVVPAFALKGLITETVYHSKPSVFSIPDFDYPLLLREPSSAFTQSFLC